MTAQILDGEAVADRIKQELAGRVERWDDGRYVRVRAG